MDSQGDPIPDPETRSRRLSDDEVMKLHVRKQRSWQHEITDLFNGEVNGVVIEIPSSLAEESRDEAEREAAYQERVKKAVNLDNAVRYRLAGGQPPKFDWKDYIDIQRTGASVIVVRKVGKDGALVPIPRAHVEWMNASKPRIGRARR